MPIYSNGDESCHSNVEAPRKIIFSGFDLAHTTTIKIPFMPSVAAILFL